MRDIVIKVKEQYLKDTSKGLCRAVLVLYYQKELTKHDIDLFYELIDGELPKKLKYGLTKQRLELLNKLIMSKYRVTLELMKDPTKGDETFTKTYNVEANSETQAFFKAEEEQAKDTEINYRPVFDYKVVKTD